MCARRPSPAFTTILLACYTASIAVVFSREQTVEFYHGKDITNVFIVWVIFTIMILPGQAVLSLLAWDMLWRWGHSKRLLSVMAGLILGVLDGWLLLTLPTELPIVTDSSLLFLFLYLLNTPLLVLLVALFGPWLLSVWLSVRKERTRQD